MADTTKVVMAGIVSIIKHTSILKLHLDLSHNFNREQRMTQGCKESGTLAQLCLTQLINKGCSFEVDLSMIDFTRPFVTIYPPVDSALSDSR